MAIERIVNSRFTANDKITKRFGIMASAAARFGLRATKSFRTASLSANRFKSVTKGVVAGIGISKGIGLLQSGLANVTRGFIDFEKAARGATVRFKDIGPDAANFNEQMKLIRKSARDAGATTEFTAAQAASALDFLARAGFTSAEAMGSLRSMIDLSTASGEDFAQVADMSSDLLGAFGLNTENTAQKIKNLNRVNDVLVKSANSANVTIETMFETMKDAAPIGRSLGIELEEIAAFTAIMGNAGIKGSKAGTALKNSFLNLSTQSPKVVKMLKSIGVQIDDGSGNMRKFTDILKDVGKNIKGLGGLDQAKILDTLFGKRAIAGATNLIDSIGQVEKFEQSLRNAGGTSKKTADIMRQSIDARLKSMGSAITEIGFKILTAFEKDGAKGIQSFTEAIRNFNPKPIIDFITLLVNGLKFLWEWRNVIMVVAGIFFTLKLALAVATVAMGIFNIVAALNPIGLIALAVVGLIAGFTALIVWIDDIAAAFDSMPAGIKLMISPLILVVKTIKWIKDNFGAIKEFFGFGARKPPEVKLETPGELEQKKRFAKLNQQILLEDRRKRVNPQRVATAIPGRDTRKLVTPAARFTPKISVNAKSQSDGREKPERVPPNREEARARAQQSTFRGHLQIAGAPKGSSIKQTGGDVGKFDVEMLGQ